MLSPNDVVKTDVDSLIEITKKQQEISFDDAAKKLGVGIDNIESWANFLEEEGIVTIKYKFTTPFLVYGGSADKAEKTPEQKLNDLFLVIEKAENHLKKNEFDLMEKVYAEATLKLKNISPSQDDQGEESAKRLSEISRLVSDAMLSNQQGNYSKSKQVFSQLNLLMREEYSRLKQFYNSLAIEKFKKKQPEQPQRSDDPQSAISQVYDYLKWGDVGKAQEAYGRLEQYYARLGQDYINKKEELNRQMIKLNKDLSLFIDKFETKKVNDLSKEIGILKLKIIDSIKNRKIDDASKLFEVMESKYSQIPQGFASIKSNIEKQIIETRALLIKSQQAVYTEEFSVKKSEIRTNLVSIKAFLASGDVVNALFVYKKTKSLFDSLPPGFLSQKIELEESILNIYKDINMAQKNVSIKEFSEKVKRIDELMIAADSSLSRSDYTSSETLINQIKGIFNDLPSGFLSEKTEIQDKILTLTKRFSEQKQKSISLDYESKSKKIAKMAENIEALAKNREFDLAKELYSEAVKIYNSIPAGFLKEKTEIRSRLLLLYKKVMTGSDLFFLSNANEQTKSKYDKLLKLLITLQNHVENREFDLMEVAYNHIISVYNELPIGFVQQNIKVREEIIKAYDVLQLYKKLSVIDETAKNKDYASLKRLLESVRSLAKEIRNNCKEYEQIFTLVDEKIGYYQGAMASFHLDGAKEQIKRDIPDNLDVPSPSYVQEIPDIPGLETQTLQKQEVKFMPLEEHDLDDVPSPIVSEHEVEEMLKEEPKKPKPKKKETEPEFSFEAKEEKAKAQEIQQKGIFGPHGFKFDDKEIIIHKVEDIEALRKDIISSIKSNDMEKAKEKVLLLDEVQPSPKNHNLILVLESLQYSGLRQDILKMVADSFKKTSMDSEIIRTKLFRGLANLLTGREDEAKEDLIKASSMMKDESIKKLVTISEKIVSKEKVETVEMQLVKMKISRASSYLESGQKDLAEEELLKVLELDPKNKQARLMMKDIGGKRGKASR